MLIKCLHITLALNLLASSVGVVINQHFCQDKLQRTALFAAVENCRGELPAEPAVCPRHQQQKSKQGVDRKDCCQDNSQLLKVSQEQQMELSQLPVVQLAAWNTGAFLPPVSVYANTSLPIFPFYRPPPRIADYAVEFQVFRL